MDRRDFIVTAMGAGLVSPPGLASADQSGVAGPGTAAERPKTNSSARLSLEECYARAVRFTAPKVAVEASRGLAEGYWLDDAQFFFTAERFEPSIGRIVSVPSVANVKTKRVEEVMSLDSLGSALAAHSGQRVDLAAFASAAFDMPKPNQLGVSVGGQDYLVDTRQRRVIAATASLQVPVLYSPDGRYACFLKEHNLWLRDRDTGAEKALTTDGAQDNAYGYDVGSSAERMPPRPHAPLGVWSADSQWFLTHRIDERSLPELVLTQHAPPGGGRPILYRYKYPMTVDPLPSATYVAINVRSGRVVSFDDLGASVAVVSPLVFHGAWFSAPDTAWFVRFDRYFKQVDLIRLDLARGKGRIVISETAPSGYIDLAPNLASIPNVRTLDRSNEIVWYSEADGWGHLYLHDAATGKLKNRITRGEWLVRDIVHIDESRRKMLFLAGGIDSKVDPARRSLCTVNLDGSGFEVLLSHAGDVTLPATDPWGLSQHHPFRPVHGQTGLSPNGQAALVHYASVERGNRTEIVDLRTRRGFMIASAQPAADEVSARQFTALAADGVTPLYGVMFLPSHFDESRRYPLIDYIYAGPHVCEHQPQSFREANSAPARSMAEVGFVTIMLDTRGMSSRNRAYHQMGYGELVEPHLADHAAVVRQLGERHPFIDAGNVGIVGYSAGGCSTARAMFDYGDVFKVGVSVCGNHDNVYYSVYMSDKYRGPGSPEKWAPQSGAARAHKLKGRLMLMSSDIDKNVHISQTLTVADALIRANKDFDLVIVPNEGHDMLITNGYVQRRVWDYFVRHLRGETPPENFEVKI